MITRSFSKILSTKNEAQAIFSALLPEVGGAYEKKAKTKIALKNNRVTFTIVAQDEGAMNASTNSYGALANYLIELEKPITGKKIGDTNHYG